jgi:hypothetical protein
MKNIARAFCAAIFLVGLLVFSLAQNSDQADTSSNVGDVVEPAQPYVMKTVQYRISQNGFRRIMTQGTTYQKANGEYRYIVYGPDGPKDDNLLSKHSDRLTIYAALSDGVYAKGVGSNTLTYMSPRSDERKMEFFRSHKSLRNNREFVRTDEVAGLKVYVMRAEIKEPAAEIEWIENSYSPRTGVAPLRNIVHFRDGSEVRSEIVSVEFKEVPEDLNDDIKDLPIQNIEEKIRKQRQE